MSLQGIAFDLMQRAVRDTFGTAISYVSASTGQVTGSGADGNQLKGVYLDGFKSIQLLDGQTITDKEPTIAVYGPDIPTVPTQNDQVIILQTGVVYVVQEARPDAHGSFRLILNRTSAL